MIYEIISYPLVFVFVFLSSFLIHELMHIKSQGINMKGTIFVKKLGMYCTPEHFNNLHVFELAGGIYTSIIMFIMTFCCVGWWQWCFLTMGYVHFFYGLYEGFISIKYRMYIYVTVICVMMMIWMVK